MAVGGRLELPTVVSRNCFQDSPLVQPDTHHNHFVLPERILWLQSIQLYFETGRTYPVILKTWNFSNRYDLLLLVVNRISIS